MRRNTDRQTDRPTAGETDAQTDKESSHNYYTRQKRNVLAYEWCRLASPLFTQWLLETNCVHPIQRRWRFTWL